LPAPERAAAVSREELAAARVAGFFLAEGFAGLAAGCFLVGFAGFARAFEEAFAELFGVGLFEAFGAGFFRDFFATVTLRV
jgi:hypothetical protein